MYVHAYDPQSGKYYKSMVYALVRIMDSTAPGLPEDMCTGEEYAILHNPLRACFEFVPRFDCTVRKCAGIPTLNRTPRYTIIQPGTVDWVQASDDFIRRLDPAVKHKVLSITGYAGVVDHLPFCIRVMRDGSVSVEKAKIALRQPDDISVWTYLRSQEDADTLLSRYNYLHDGVINRMAYEEADDRTFRLTLTLGCGETQIQLCFEGVTEMHLKTQIGWQREMAFGQILVSDAYTVWMFNAKTEAEIRKDTTYVKALNLKWRKIG